ncbi:hypothetical protein SAMN04488524_0081 [Pedobacter africanus]|uniref:Uncharacterized protein n=1 Tax=Pedobacter africanus TaxID=151894 RepID=A0A1W1YPD9_9SPHI|nr:hypothetical protein SAMN04488524_0081 [Pedobacter africanus]
MPGPVARCRSKKPEVLGTTSGKNGWDYPQTVNFSFNPTNQMYELLQTICS